MAKPCFFHSSLKAGDSVLELSQSESAHALQSRRLAVGSEVWVINGRGAKAAARITETDRRKVVLDIDEVSTVTKPRFELSMAVAFPKGDRQKVMIDMLVQLGVSRVIPLTCQYSTAPLKDSQIEKLQRLVIGACKQSQNPWLMDISPTASFESMLEQVVPMFYGDQNGSARPALNTKESRALVFIGPEGGFSDAEFEALKAHNAQGFTLGRHILRTETAAVTAAAAFNELLINEFL